MLVSGFTNMCVCVGGWGGGLCRVVLWGGGGGGGGGGGLEGKQNVLVKQTSAKQKAHVSAPWNTPHISETADQHWLDFNFA